MASEGMAGTNELLASTNGIRRDDRDKWMISFGYASEGMTGTNNWLASANGIQRDNRDKRMISFGQLHLKGWLGQTID
jgi:hypothetical protein